MATVDENVLCTENLQREWVVLRIKIKTSVSLCAREAVSPTQETLSCLFTMCLHTKVSAQCGYANQLDSHCFIMYICIRALKYTLYICANTYILYLFIIITKYRLKNDTL